MVKMNNSIKIPKEDLMKINELKLELTKMNIKITQKDIIDSAIKFSLSKKMDFIKRIRNKKMENEYDFNKILSGKKFDMGKDWMKNIDTTI